MRCISLRVPEQEYKKFRVEAARECLSMNQYVIKKLRRDENSGRDKGTVECRVS